MHVSLRDFDLIADEVVERDDDASRSRSKRHNGADLPAACVVGLVKQVSAAEPGIDLRSQKTRDRIAIRYNADSLARFEGSVRQVARRAASFFNRQSGLHSVEASDDRRTGRPAFGVSSQQDL